MLGSSTSTASLDAADQTGADAPKGKYRAISAFFCYIDRVLQDYSICSYNLQLRVVKLLIDTDNNFPLISN